MISIEQIKELRDRTSVGMTTCKKALEEAGGDMDKAIEVLRKSGEAKAAEKSTRSTKEGTVAINGRAIVKLSCETDFVARNERFVAFAESIALEANNNGKESAEKLFNDELSIKTQEIGENIQLGEISILSNGNVVASYLHSNNKVGTLVALDGGDEIIAKDIAMHVTAMSPLVVSADQVPVELVEKEKEIAGEQLKNEGKPEGVWDKIIEGKIKKFCAEQALLSQSFVKDPSQTVEQYAGSAKVLEFARVAV